MTRTRYDIEMEWAECWSDIFDILADYLIVDLDKWWFRWTLSQTGFTYMEYPYNPGIHKDW